MSGGENQGEIGTSHRILVLLAVRHLPLMGTLPSHLPKALLQRKGRQIWVSLPLLQTRSPRLKDGRCLPQGWSSSWNKTAQLEDQSPLPEGSPGREGRLWSLPITKAFPHRGLPHFQKGTLPGELSFPSGYRVLLDGSPPQSLNTYRGQAPQGSLVTCVTVPP